MTKEEVLQIIRAHLTVEVWTKQSDNTITVKLFLNDELISQDRDIVQVEPITNL